MSYLQLYAQGGGERLSGARAAGMGFTSVTHEDAAAVFNNIAGTANLKSIQAFAGYEHRFSLNAFNTSGMSLALPRHWGTPAISAHRFGDDVFNIQNLGIGYAHSIDKVNLGVKINYLQYNVSEFGTGRFLVFEMGGIMELIPEVKIGAHIYNLNQARVDEFQDERIPTIMKAGISWQADKKVIINIETLKDLDHKPVFRAGIEYQMVEHFVARTGFSTNPFINTIGVGFHRNSLFIDYAIGMHYQLGFLQQLSLVKKFKRRHES
ncbi:hypothetical protein RCC89_09270 [Cytophagaceae bacterium ABcell3]|nr:hypothetical protein RCC89_09270 [Cytophagaceae bacterium ABcell3]